MGFDRVFSSHVDLDEVVKMLRQDLEDRKA